MDIKKVKRKAERRILKGMIQFISLVPAGANEISTIYKSGDKEEEVHLSQLTKAMTEEGEIISVVYAPERVDDQGDIASAAVIKDFAHDFMQKGGQIDIRHNEQALSKESIFVAESTIVQKGDPRFADMKDYDGNAVDVTGGWGVILKVNSEELRAAYRSGEWAGTSMGGSMYYKKVAEGNTNVNSNTENEMDEKEVIKIATDAAVAAVIAINKEAETKAAEEAKIAKEKADALAAATPKGLGMAAPVCADPSAEGLFQHRKCLKIHELQKTVNPESESEVFEFEVAARKIASATTQEELATVCKKEAGRTYESFFLTNQVPGAPILKESASVGNEMADAILADIAKEQAAANGPQVQYIPVQV